MSIFKNIFCVITAPKYGWEVINDSNISTGRVLVFAFFPLLAVMGLTCFVPMIYDSTLTFTHQLMEGIVLFSSYFISYYIISYVLSGFYPELVKSVGAVSRLNNYILYNLIFLVLLEILCNVLPSDFTPVMFLKLYMPVMAYRGTGNLFVSKNKVMKFTAISASLILFLPILFNWILGRFI